MDKKLYFAPELEEIELDMQGNVLLDMSTDNSENNSDDITDI